MDPSLFRVAIVRRSKTIRSFMQMRHGSTVVLIPYLGLTGLQYLNYVDLSREMYAINDQSKTPDRETMDLVWKSIVHNLYYFEDSLLLVEKLAEVRFLRPESPVHTLIDNRPTGVRLGFTETA